jgi:uncharacterized protein (TIGR02996 family)
MSSNLEALWAAVKLDPKDLSAQLVLADAVQESGDDDLAELLRVRVEIARLDGPPLACPTQVEIEPVRDTFFDSLGLPIDRAVYQATLIVRASHAPECFQWTVIDVLLPMGGDDKIITDARVVQRYQTIEQLNGNLATIVCHIDEVALGRRDEIAPLRRRECELTRICYPQPATP